MAERRLRRACKRCMAMFEPTGRFCYYCEECKKKAFQNAIKKRSDDRKTNKGKNH